MFSEKEADILCRPSNASQLRRSRSQDQVHAPDTVKAEDYIFIFPEKDEIWEHDVDDVVMKLPGPIRVGGTARSSKQFKFRPKLLCKFGVEIE